MARPEYEALYGGAAGGGKSDALLIEALRQVHIPHYRAIIFRKTYPQLTELIDRSRDLYKRAYPKASYNPEDAKWFHDNLRLIAEHAARGFCEYFGIEFVDPYAKPKGFWRLYEIEGALSIQRGAYSNKEGLLKHAEQLLDEGKIIRYEFIKK